MQGNLEWEEPRGLEEWFRHKTGLWDEIGSYGMAYSSPQRFWNTKTQGSVAERDGHARADIGARVPLGMGLPHGSQQSLVGGMAS
jgi:hypothetical protein